MASDYIITLQSRASICIRVPFIVVCIAYSVSRTLRKIGVIAQRWVKHPEGSASGWIVCLHWCSETEEDIWLACSCWDEARHLEWSSEGWTLYSGLGGGGRNDTKDSDSGIRLDTSGARQVWYEERGSVPGSYMRRGYTYTRSSVVRTPVNLWPILHGGELLVCRT